MCESRTLETMRLPVASFGGRFHAFESGASHRTPRRCRAGEDGMGQSSVRAGMRARSEKGCAKRFKCEGAQILGRSGFIDLQRIAMRAQRYAQVIADILSAKCEVRNGRASEDIFGCAKAALCAALHDAVALAGSPCLRVPREQAGVLGQKKGGRRTKAGRLWGKGLGKDFTIMSTFSDILFRWGMGNIIQCRRKCLRRRPGFGR